jgi:hypothetical protein
MLVGRRELGHRLRQRLRQRILSVNAVLYGQQPLAFLLQAGPALLNVHGRTCLPLVRELKRQSLVGSGGVSGLAAPYLMKRKVTVTPRVRASCERLDEVRDGAKRPPAKKSAAK